MPADGTITIERPRIGLIESWFHDMDAGWTRFVLDRAGIPFEVLRPGDIETTDLEKRFDVLLFPDQTREILLGEKPKGDGHYWRPTYPPEFTRPISADGMKKLTAWIDQGGIVVSWGRSTGVFLGPLELPAADEDEKPEKFELPVRDISEKLKEKGLLVPGAFLSVDFLPDHPLTWGMPEHGGIFSRGAPVFSTSIPEFDMDRRVIAHHPKGDVLISGYDEHGELLENKPVMVWVRKNHGQIVLMGFSPQFRASTPVDAKLLFNALLLPPVE